MVKEITIGNTPVKFKSSASLPILYRELTGREFYLDLQGTQEGNPAAALEMAYVMYKSANPDDPATQKEWLDRFEFADLNKALLDVLSMLSAETKTTSSAKKNSAR